MDPRRSERNPSLITCGESFHLCSGLQSLLLHLARGTIWSYAPYYPRRSGIWAVAITRRDENDTCVDNGNESEIIDSWLTLWARWEESCSGLVEPLNLRNDWLEVRRMLLVRDRTHAGAGRFDLQPVEFMRTKSYPANPIQSDYQKQTRQQRKIWREVDSINKASYLQSR